MLSVGNYVDFCLKFILAFGAVFELPIVIVFLTRMGIVTPKTLAKNRKYAVLVAFMLAALLTPTPDAFNRYSWPSLSMSFRGRLTRVKVLCKKRGRKMPNIKGKRTQGRSQRCGWRLCNRESIFFLKPLEQEAPKIFFMR